MLMKQQRLIQSLKNDYLITPSDFRAAIFPVRLWLSNKSCPITALSKTQVTQLFLSFENMLNNDQKIGTSLSGKDIKLIYFLSLCKAQLNFLLLKWLHE